MIYFIQNTTSLMIKIGYTGGDPAQRLRSLQTGHADRLELLGSIRGDKHLERTLHRKLNKHRVTGEWFRPDDEVMKLMDSLLHVSESGNLDLSALANVCRCAGTVTGTCGHEVVLVHPLRDYDSHMEFDRAVCAAGLKTFIRASMESDYPGFGTAVDIKTMKPDPSIAIPKIELGDFVLVSEASTGIRTRVGIGSIYESD